jgi:hypothetical protein
MRHDPTAGRGNVRALPQALTLDTDSQAVAAAPCVGAQGGAP